MLVVADRPAAITIGHWCRTITALDIAYVAAGRLDAYWQRGLKSWDFAAGAVLLAAGLVAVLVVEEKPLRSGRDDLGREDLRPDADRIAAE